MGLATQHSWTEACNQCVHVQSHLWVGWQQLQQVLRHLQLLKGPLKQLRMCYQPTERQQGCTAAGLRQGQLGHQPCRTAPL